jgi:CheY-like chemotaxis protein
MPGERVLVIEDEFLTRVSLVAFLEEMGYDVAGAESGMEAIDLQRNECYDLCIVDIRMPDMDGTETIMALHKLDPKTRYIVYTGSPQFSLASKLEELGLSSADVVRKPVMDMQIFVRMIEQRVGGSTDE